MIAPIGHRGRSATGADPLAGGCAAPSASVSDVTRLPWNRLLAWIVDWCCVLAWVCVVAAIGIPLYLLGITGTLPVVWLNLMATATLIVPVTVGLAALESSTREASLGKRATGLTVVSARTGTRLGFPRALARNALKLAVPWMIGHAAVYEIVDASATGSVPISTWVLTAIAYILPITYVVSLFVGTGRTPYDRICATEVVKARRHR